MGKLEIEVRKAQGLIPAQPAAAAQAQVLRRELPQ